MHRAQFKPAAADNAGRVLTAREIGQWIDDAVGILVDLLVFPVDEQDDLSRVAELPFKGQLALRTNILGPHVVASALRLDGIEPRD